ncbi:MAG TPA: hypothetical protein VLG46_11375 [Anaerolineae bacterium]|nr:hypothetical protein [Anaerolineae bacterium]
MPRQNRVTPFSTLIATSARGTLTGNRGCLHNEHGQIRRAFLGQRWIICLLEFKGRRRTIMQPGHYTELFFLDEVTALAAGHRPCAECQRDRFNLFRDIWASANPELAGTARPAATAIDAALHSERTATSAQQRRDYNSLEELPTGTFVTDDEHSAYLVRGHQLLRWAPEGYEDSSMQVIHYPLRVLTPASIVRALAAGYPAGIHPSASMRINHSSEKMQR